MKRKKHHKKQKFSQTKILSSIIVILAIATAVFFLLQDTSQGDVSIKTSMGEIVLDLNEEEAPITVANFKSYIEEGFYDGLVFHRVISDFMIQGGGFAKTGEQKQTKAPIKLESNNGLTNDEYTIAMARTMVADSATSQFFINTKNNEFLNYRPGNDGYAVFGKVVKGKDVVDAIESVETTTKYGYMADWPIEEVTIKSIKLI